jgi:hypothetical protein
VSDISLRKSGAERGCGPAASNSDGNIYVMVTPA